MATMNAIPATAPGLVFFRSVQSKLEYLYDRWQDEKEYEDFAEYKKVAQGYCTGDVKFEKLTKSPFALTFTSDGHTYTAKINSRQVSITRRAV